MQVKVENDTSILYENIENMNNFNCKDCGLNFENLCDIYEHISNVHSKEFDNYKCEKCEKTFKKYFSLKMHIKVTHDKEDSLICTFCSKKFGQFYYLKVHISDEHEDKGDIPVEEVTVTPCSECNETFEDICEFYKHVHTTHNPRDNLNLCYKICDCTASLQTHALVAQ